MEIYTKQEKMSLWFWGACLAGLAGTSLVLAGPWLAPASVGLVAAGMATSIFASKARRAKSYEKSASKAPVFTQFRENCRDITIRAGMHAPEEILDTASLTEKARRTLMREKLRVAKGPLYDLMQQGYYQPLAAVSMLSPHQLLISSGLLHALPADEQKAVYAHEVGHLVAQHKKIVFKVAALKLLAVTASALEFVASAFALDWPLGVAAVGVLAGGVFASARGWSSMAQQNFALMTVGVIGDFLGTAWALPVHMFAITMLTASLAHSRISQTMEYQADRLGIALGASPAASISMLARLRALIERDLQKPACIEKPKWWQLPWTITLGLFASHPSDDDRRQKIVAATLPLEYQRQFEIEGKSFLKVAAFDDDLTVRAYWAKPDISDAANIYQPALGPAPARPLINTIIEKPKSRFFVDLNK